MTHPLPDPDFAILLDEGWDDDQIVVVTARPLAGAVDCERRVYDVSWFVSRGERLDTRRRNLLPRRQLHQTL